MGKIIVFMIASHRASDVSAVHFIFVCECASGVRINQQARARARERTSTYVMFGFLQVYFSSSESTTFLYMCSKR